MQTRECKHFLFENERSWQKLTACMIKMLKTCMICLECAQIFTWWAESPSTGTRKWGHYSKTDEIFVLIDFSYESYLNQIWINKSRELLRKI